MVTHFYFRFWSRSRLRGSIAHQPIPNVSKSDQWVISNRQNFKKATVRHIGLLFLHAGPPTKVSWWSKVLSKHLTLMDFAVFVDFVVSNGLGCEIPTSDQFHQVPLLTECTKFYQILVGHGTISALDDFVVAFRYVAPYRNQGDWWGQRSTIEACRTFSLLQKLGERWANYVSKVLIPTGPLFGKSAIPNICYPNPNL